MQQYTRQSADQRWSEFVSLAGAQYLFSDLSELDSRWAFERLCPEPLTQLAEAVSLRAFWESDIPRSYILYTEDRAYPIDYMRQAAKRLGVKPVLMDSGHFPMINRPRAVAELLVKRIPGGDDDTTND